MGIKWWNPRTLVSVTLVICVLLLFHFLTYSSWSSFSSTTSSSFLTSYLHCQRIIAWILLDFSASIMLRCLCLPDTHVVYIFISVVTILIKATVFSSPTASQPSRGKLVPPSSGLEQFLKWTSVIWKLPVFDLPVADHVSWEDSQSSFVIWPPGHDTLMPSASSDRLPVCTRIFLGLFFFPLSFSFYPMKEILSFINCHSDVLQSSSKPPQAF